MDDDLRHADDISQLWGAEDAVVWEPAPLRRDDPLTSSTPHTTNGDGDARRRMDALERELRALVQAVARAEGRVAELERQVADLTAKLDAGDPRRRAGHDGTGRLSRVIKATKKH